MSDSSDDEAPLWVVFGHASPAAAEEAHARRHANDQLDHSLVGAWGVSDEVGVTPTPLDTVERFDSGGKAPSPASSLSGAPQDPNSHPKRPRSSLAQVAEGTDSGIRPSQAIPTMAPELPDARKEMFSPPVPHDVELFAVPATLVAARGGVLVRRGARRAFSVVHV